MYTNMNVLTKVSNTCEKSRLALFLSVCQFKRNITDTSNKVSIEVPDDESLQEREQKIERIRDKSRLRPDHRNVLYNKKPYSEPMIESHLTVKYNRKLYGKYGSDSGVYPGIMWPTTSDIESIKEYEKVAFPFTIQEMVERAKTEIEMRELEDQKLQKQVIDNLSKLDLWKKELEKKIAKKEAEALAAKQKRDKLIEEVRRHFGFTVDPRDEKFKEMVAAKEKEQRKKEKRARMEERERKAIAHILEKNESDQMSTSKPGDST